MCIATKTIQKMLHVWFQKFAQTVFFQKQHGTGKNDWPVQTNKQTLINSYKQNQILRDNADPNYRNKVKRSLIKVKSVALLTANFQKEYRYRNLHEAKLRELMEQLEGQFTVAEIKQQWHNLLTNYKREKQREESSKSSGSGSSEVYSFSWPYYHSMSCTDNTHEMDKSQNFLFPFAIPEKLKKLPTKTSSRDDELSSKVNLWRIFTTQMTYGASNTNNFLKQDRFTLEEKARIFGQSITGGLLEKTGRKF